MPFGTENGPVTFAIVNEVASFVFHESVAESPWLIVPGVAIRTHSGTAGGGGGGGVTVTVVLQSVFPPAPLTVIVNSVVVATDTDCEPVLPT